MGRLDLLDVYRDEDHPEAVEHPLRAGEARDESPPATATEPQDA